MKGNFVLDEELFDAKKGIIIWQDTNPLVMDFEVTNQPKTISIYNVWETENGVIHWWFNGAAMIVEELANGRHYRCNDGFPDDDFDDIIFRLERRGGDKFEKVDHVAHQSSKRGRRRPNRLHYTNIANKPRPRKSAWIIVAGIWLLGAMPIVGLSVGIADDFINRSFAELPRTAIMVLLLCVVILILVIMTNRTLKNNSDDPTDGD